MRKTCKKCRKIHVSLVIAKADKNSHTSLSRQELSLTRFPTGNRQPSIRFEYKFTHLLKTQTRNGDKTNSSYSRERLKTWLYCDVGIHPAVGRALFLPYKKAAPSRDGRSRYKTLLGPHVPTFIKTKTCHLSQKDDRKISPAVFRKRHGEFSIWNCFGNSRKTFRSTLNWHANNWTKQLTVNYLDLSGHRVSNYIAAVAIHSHNIKYSTTHAHLTICLQTFQHFEKYFFVNSVKSLAHPREMSTVTVFVEKKNYHCLLINYER